MHADFILFFRNSKPISTKGGKSGVLGEIPDFYHTKTGESLTFLTFTPTYGIVIRMASESPGNPLPFLSIYTRKPSQNQKTQTPQVRTPKSLLKQHSHHHFFALLQAPISERGPECLHVLQDEEYHPSEEGWAPDLPGRNL